MKYKNLFLPLILAAFCITFTGCDTRKYGVIVNKHTESRYGRYGASILYSLDVVTTNRVIVSEELFNFNNVGDKYTWVE